MKFKRLFFTLLYSSVCSTFALTCKADTNNICDLLRKELSPLQGFPNDPVDILFFDINHDGIPDALVSFRMDKSSGGCHGNSWMLFRFEKGEWNQSPFKETDDDNWSSYNSVFARGDDFYSLAMDGQKPKLVLIYTSHNNEGYGWVQDDSACEITIDEDGHLKAIPIPELTTQYLSPHDEGELPPFDVLPPHLQSLVTNIPSQASIEMRKLLVPLSIESFDPLANEAQRPGAAAAHAATPKRNPWLYLAVLPVILAAVFYALRRAFPQNEEL